MTNPTRQEIFSQPASGWLVKQPLDGTWAAMPADASHPDFYELSKLQPSLVLACDYTYLIGPLSDQPGIVEDND